jgi:phosphoserine phosphatase
MIKGDIGEAMFYYQLEHFLFRASPVELWPDHPDREELDDLFNALRSDRAVTPRQNSRFGPFANMMLSWYFDQLAERKTAKACADIVKLWSGFTAAEIREIAEETFLHEYAQSLGTRTLGRYELPRGVRFIRESVAILRRLTEIGFDIWAVSGSSQWSVEPVFRRLGVPADHVIGIGLVCANGVYTPEVVTPIPVLEGKVDALRHHIPGQPVFVASDSVYDIPLLEYSSRLKLLVNSRNEASDSFFREGAIIKDSSWEIIESPTTEE